MPKRVATGRVTSDRMDKTRVVEIPRKVRHPKYGKFIRQRTVCYVHDENNDSSLGDTVKIVEAAPKSRKKRWSLVEVIERSREVDVAAMRAARKLADQESTGDGGLPTADSAAPAGSKGSGSEDAQQQVNS